MRFRSNTMEVLGWAGVIAGLLLLAQWCLVSGFEQVAIARLQAGEVAAARTAFGHVSWLGGDRARAAHALGMALYRRGEFSAAAAEFAIVAAADDADMRSVGRFNRGNALLRAAEGVVDSDRPRAMALLEEAVAEYDRVIAAAPGVADARDNRELAGARLAAVRTAGRPRGETQADAQPSSAGHDGTAGERRDAAARKASGVEQLAGATSASEATANVPPASGTPTTESPRRARPELSAMEAERMLGAQRGRERVTGTLHGVRRLERQAKPDRDW